MKLTENEWFRTGRLATLFLAAMMLAPKCLDLNLMVQAQAVSTTTVQGTVYLANGQAGTGTLVVSWPTFTTAAGQMVTADSTTVTIPADGFVSVSLAPNQGSTPAGEFYTAVYYMSDGSSNTQYWVIPAAAQATLAQVQAQVMPAAQAVQTVSKAYVDQSISELTGSQLTASGGTLSGPLYLNGDPTQALQAATKHYVDTQVETAVPLAGGNMTGALQTPALNGVEVPTTASAQTTLQAAMSAAGTNGAMQIPPTYAGADTFTNPNGVRVTDLRTGGAQQVERSVKEFGAACNGVTDDTNALQAAMNYAQTHGVALTIPEGTCKTHSLNWHGESIGGLGKQVSALMGFPGQDVLATVTDNPNLLSYTRLHDLTIYVDQSMDVSCSAATGRAQAGSCQMGRQMEGNSIFSPGGNGLAGTTGTGTAWAVGNCAIAMPAATGTGGNGLKVAEIENLEIAATGTDPMAAQYPGAHSTHVCGMYLAQWPQWSEFRNIDIRGLNTGVAIPALPVSAPAGLNADSNRWQNVTIQATHGFTAAAGSNNVLDNVVELAGNSAATGEPPTGLVLDLSGSAQGWTVRNAVVMPSWTAVQPTLTVTAAGGAVTAVAVGTEHGLGFDPYGATVPLSFSGSCTAQAAASVNSNGSIGSVSVTSGGVGCSATTTASVNVAGTWDTSAPVNLIGGQNMTFFAGNLLKGNGGYTVWNATASEGHGTELGGGGGTLPGGGTYAALVGSARVGTAYQVDQFPGADIGAKIQACLKAVNTSYGGTCDARNFAGNLSMGSNLTISTGNTTVQLPCATIATSAQVIVTAGTRNVALRGCALRGGSAASGNQGGTVLEYSGAGAMIQVGDPTYAVDTPGFHLDDVVINTTGATSGTAQGLVAYRTQEMDLESLYFLGNQNQTGMTLDGTGNYTGGTFLDNELEGFGTALNGIGHQVANPATTDWANASTFVRLHVVCPTSAGNPISGTYGINLAAGDGNTFTGGDVEGCSTALHLGANAQNNTIVGLRNENSTSQVVADAGSQYNNWMTGGTMFTSKLTDNGTRNSFLDTFHRSFNGLNGDWYGSQQDATVTNHYRLGTGAGNERGLLDEYQTDYGYRWTTGLSDATGGEQFYQILDQLNNVYRVSIGQYNSGQSSTNNQTVINAAGTGAVVLNGSTNAGTGGVVFGSGGASESTVATISNAGNAQFNGTLQVSGTSQSGGTMTVRNNADAEVDYYLWPGLTTSQKGSLTYKDWNGNSQWYMLKDASNNWALNSAVGGLDSFKAYQSSNSGDTYIDASNATGHIRLNYETGSGAETDIYSGSSSSLAAAFLSPTSIKFPGLAAASGHYCVQIDNSGYITNTGSACGTGSGGSGTVSGLTANYVPLATGATAISSSSHLYENGSQDVFTQPVTANENNMINVMAPPFGASCNLTQYTGGNISTGSAVLTGSGFTAGLVGQTAVVWNAGGLATNGSYAPLVATVASFQSATQITLSANATSTVSSGLFEIGSLDSTAIQGAYNAAAASNLSLLIPANAGKSCLTGPIDLSAGSTLSNPVPIHGQGSYVSSVTGLPGQDVLAWPDGRQVKSGYAKIDGLTIVVDTGLDVSSAAGGSAAFPNRITGEIGNGSGGLAVVSPAISPGPVSFTSGAISQSGDSTYDELTVAAANGGQFNVNPAWMTVGSPVTIPSLGINGTITAVLNQTQIKFSPAYSAAASSLSGTWGAGLTPPWYVGNCGIAIPASSGLNSGGMQMIFEDLNFQIAAGNSAFGNHSCAMFFQQPPYWTRFQRITAQNFYYGYIEALPTSNNNISWTPDTSHYVDINISATIPLVQYGGNHRILDGISLYSADHPLGLGAFFFNGPMNNAGGSTVTHFYGECWSNNTGENQRWYGSQWTIDGGSLTQCNGPYVNWSASQSLVTDTGIGGPSAPTASTAGLQLSGSNNVFDQMSVAGNSANSATGVAVGQVNDSGTGNRVSDAKTGTRIYALNAPQPVSGMLDGAFAQSGNFGCSFASAADLFTRYNDWYMSASGITTTYVQDLMTNDGNLAGSYLQLPANGSGGNVKISFWGSPMSVGYRMPQCGTINAVVYGEAPGGATTFTVKIYDQTTSTLLTTCNYILTTGWAFHGQAGSVDACTFSTSALAAGDLIDAIAYSSSTDAVNMGSLTFTPQASNVVAQTFTPVGAGARASGTVSNFELSATNPISNYIGGGYMEVESNGTCESVSQQGGSFTYSTATDANCEGWSAGTNISTLTGTYNPGSYNGGFSIAKSGSTYYMIVDSGGTTAGAGKLYLLSATALAGPWTVQNGGNPVLSAGTSTSYTYYMYNPALAIVGSNWLLLIEGGSSAVPDMNTSYSYATGCPSSCSFTANLTGAPLFGGNNGYKDNLGFAVSSSSGSPQLIYVPDDNAIVALMTMVRNGQSYLGAYTISSASPAALATFTDWTQSNNFDIWIQNLSSGGPSDPRLYFSSSVGLKGFNAILSMYTNTTLGTYQAYSPLTLDQWYASLVNPVSSAVPQWVNQNGTGAPLMSNNPYGPLNFTVYPTATWNPSYAVRGETLDAGAGGTQAGLQGTASFVGGTAASTDTLRGVAGYGVQNTSGYNLSNLEAGYFQNQFSYATGTVTNSYGVYIDQPTSPAGTTSTTTNGLYINTQSGNCTNCYAINQHGASDLNNFNGASTFNNTVLVSPASSGTTSVTAVTGKILSSATGGTIIGSEGQVNWQGGSANDAGQLIGVEGTVVPNQAYTVTNAKAGYFIVQPQATTDLVTNAYGVYIDAPTNPSAISTAYGLYVGSQAGASGHFAIDQVGTTDTNYFAAPLTTPGVLAQTLYSAAGTALPTCASGIKGERAVVSDATSPTYMGAYASGGGITAEVICSYNGSTYSWLTH